MADSAGPRSTVRRKAQRRGRRPRPSRALAVLLAVTAAVSLLVLAVPRTVALLRVMPAERTISQLERRLPVDPEAIDAAIEAALEASAWIDSGTLWQDVARARLGRMQLLGSDRQAQADVLLQAESSLQRSLARRPGNPYAWWQLAMVANALRQPTDRVAAALRLSVVTGGRVGTLLFPRLRLALAKWAQLDGATRDAFRPQLVMAMRTDPRAFVTLVRRSLAEDEVRAALRDEGDLLEAYQSLIGRLPRLPGVARNGA